MIIEAYTKPKDTKKSSTKKLKKKKLTKKEANKNPKKKIDLAFCWSIFMEMVSDLRKIWGALITFSLLENLLCELMRLIERTRRNTAHTDNLYQMDCVVDMDLCDVKESTKKDLVFFDEQRGRLQNFFSNDCF